MTKINEPLEKDLTLLQNQLKDTSPLIHCITNPISINDCANMVLAIGGRPIMAEHPGEVAEITAISQALALNLGNITDARMESMGIAGKTAKEKAVPITIDLVGTACSTMRKDYAQKLLAEIQPQIIKGNISEIRAVCGLESHSSGIDANAKELITEANVTSYNEVFPAYAREHHCTILISGPLDYITDGTNTCLCSNGTPQLASITGTGCMLNVITATCTAAASQLNIPMSTAALLATGLLGIAGEIATRNAKGPGTFHTELFDAIANLTPATLLPRLRLTQAC